MKIAIDAFRLVCERNTSGHTYVKELAVFLAAEHGVDQILLLVPFPADVKLLAFFAEMSKIIFVVDSKYSDPGHSWINQTIWIQFRIPHILRTIDSQDKPDSLIAPYHQTPLLVGRNIRVATVIHDICGFDVDSGYKKFRWPYLKHAVNFMTARFRADVLLPISEFTRREFLARYPAMEKRILSPVYNAVSSTTLQDSVVNTVLKEIGIIGRYFVAFSATGLRKGTDITLVAYLEYRRRGGDAALVLLGGTAANSYWGAIADEMGVLDVQWKSGISDTERDALYAGALALVFPSRCEGFGYPIVEAMRQGCPVIATKASPANEIVGEVIPLMQHLAGSTVASEMQRYSGAEADVRTRLKPRLIAQSNLFLTTRIGEAFANAVRRD